MLHDASNPEIKKLRAKVEAGIAEARRGAVEQVQLGAEKLRQVTDSVVSTIARRSCRPPRETPRVFRHEGSRELQNL
jgi:hypothetical protein